jgi:uncharacterized protein YkwD
MQNRLLIVPIILQLMFSCSTLNELFKTIQLDRGGPYGEEGIEEVVDKEKLKGTNSIDFRFPVTYKTNPSKTNCYEGALSAETKENVTELINHIRALHGLNPVAYNDNDDTFAQKGALIIAANKALHHFPPKSWKCWSEDGYKGCNSSNIFGGSGKSYIPLESVLSWLVDDNVKSLGHRRWILSPFLKTIAYGHVEFPDFMGATLFVINKESQETDVEFVAYPYGDYPSQFFNIHWYLSFSAIIDKKNVWNNRDVNYAASSITIVSADGEKPGVTSIGFDNEGYGVPNILQWKVKGLKTGIRYDVTIKNVKIKGGKKDYEYWFVLN